tara:strand:+ start:127 stop:525 length:399 start_codon:yes stop_codon:yes gene_type:complete
MFSIVIGFDKEFMEHFDKIRGLDWKGLDLWVFGGIVSNWKTKDIDSIIIGDRIPEGFLKQIYNLGPWDITYTNEKNSIWFPGDNPIKFKLHTMFRGIQYCKLPSIKQKNRFKQGFKYGKPVKLIDQGVIQFK